MSIDSRRPVPFRDVEEAWFWTIAALRARHDGTRRRDGVPGVPRPCEPDDVVKCLDRLYGQHLLSLAHARALRRWGERGLAPDKADRRDPDLVSAGGPSSLDADAKLWREAMARLGPSLRGKGIVE